MDRAARMSQELEKLKSALEGGELVLNYVSGGAQSHEPDFCAAALLGTVGARRPSQIYGDLRESLDKYARVDAPRTIFRLSGLPTAYFASEQGGRAIPAAIELSERLLSAWEGVYESRLLEFTTQFSTQANENVYRGPWVLRGDLDQASVDLRAVHSHRMSLEAQLMGILGKLDMKVKERNVFYAAVHNEPMPYALPAPRQ